MKVKVYQHRWACHKGHFIAESAITSEDQIDPGAYYGISSTTTGECRVCGPVLEPHLVHLGESEIEIGDQEAIPCAS